MNGIFCLEGFWYGDHRDRTTVYPVLDLMNKIEKLPFIHHRCGTVEEFKFSVSRWKTKSFHTKYPILYLAFHGREDGKILIGKEEISLQQLADIMGDKCQGTIIYFGSCETMKIDKRLLQNFMEQTKVLALLGFKTAVSWLRSASFDIQMLSYLLYEKLDTKGITTIYYEIQVNCRSLIRELEFRMEVNERIPFPARK